jgi:chorismate mutase/prephenate dehydratase
MGKLEGYRDQIDHLDDRILGLLNQRAKLVLKIRDAKHGGGNASGGAKAYAPHREKQVYQRLMRQNQGPFPNEGVVAVYREVMSASLALEGRPRIAHLGPALTFTHQAALSKFGSQCEYLAVPGIPETFAEVDQGRADYGVVPVENSTEGVIRHTLDLFVESDLKICSELSLPIRLSLMSSGGGSKASGYRAIISHPQPLAQARGWLDRHFPGLERLEAASTTQAAQAAAADPRLAVVADKAAGEAYGLKLVAKNIQDKSDNTTRFLVIGRTLSQPSGHDKTSLMLSLRDRVGALASMLKPFQKHRLSLTSIESRPSRRRAWEYFFFLDFLGHQDEPKVRRLLAELRKQVVEIKVLGSYPVA